MTTRRIGLGIGAVVTTVLPAAAATIEALGGGAAPAVGIIGALVGLVAGVVAGVLVGAVAARVADGARAALAAYATLGPAFVAIATLSYLNVPGADAVFVFPVHVGTSAAIAAAVALSCLGRDRSGHPTTARER